MGKRDNSRVAALRPLNRQSKSSAKACDQVQNIVLTRSETSPLGRPVDEPTTQSPSVAR